MDVIERCDSVAVDTEANSMHAYRPELCLIQVSGGASDWVLDPLAGFDFDPFLAILEDPSVQKIFHDAEFDVLLLGRSHDVRLRGLFDTKVVATAIGEKSFGLAALVEKHFGVALDKSQQRSDWGKRPLADKQLRYAADDTHYLHELRDALEQELEAQQEITRLEVDAEFRRLERLRPRPDESSPDDWVKVKGVHRLQAIEMRVFRELWRWREGLAKKRNVPPFKIVGNAQLLGLARSRPRDMPGVERVQGMRGRLAERHGSALIRIVEANADQPGITRPQAPKRSQAERRRDVADAELLDQLKRWRKRVSEARATDPSLVMHREVLERLSRCHPRPSSREDLLATGDFEEWRLDAHADDLLAIVGAARSGDSGASESAPKSASAKRRPRRRRRD